MTETQERFLRTVLTRVALDSVVELHLFPPIRRGTLETGVAVIVTRLPPAPLVVLPDGIADAESDGVADIADDSPYADEVSFATADASGVQPAEAAADASDDVSEDVSDDVSDDASEDVSADVSDDVSADVSADAVVAASPETIAAADVTQSLIEPFRAPSPRMRILTASYRHTIKGVERGKWTADVQEEADAPLEAVELVLRGVRHRSTEPADPESISLDALDALVAPRAVAPAA